MVHVLMRDEKEERKKQARSNKQTRHSNTARPRQHVQVIVAGIGCAQECITIHIYRQKVHVHAFGHPKCVEKHILYTLDIYIYKLNAI